MTVFSILLYSVFRIRYPYRQSGTIVNHGDCLSDNMGYGKALGRWHDELLIGWNWFGKFFSC